MWEALLARVEVGVVGVVGVHGYKNNRVLYPIAFIELNYRGVVGFAVSDRMGTENGDAFQKDVFNQK